MSRFQPRNTLVLLRRVEEKEEKKVGRVIVVTQQDLFADFIVVAVGPGTKLTGGARSETHDVNVGDRVYVRYRDPGHDHGGNQTLNVAGPTILDDEGKPLLLLEQTRIVGVYKDAPALQYTGCDNHGGPQPLVPDPAVCAVSRYENEGGLVSND